MGEVFLSYCYLGGSPLAWQADIPFPFSHSQHSKSNTSPEHGRQGQDIHHCQDQSLDVGGRGYQAIPLLFVQIHNHILINDFPSLPLHTRLFSQWPWSSLLQNSTVGCFFTHIIQCWCYSFIDLLLLFGLVNEFTGLFRFKQMGQTRVHLRLSQEQCFQLIHKCAYFVSMTVQVRLSNAQIIVFNL